MTVTGNYVQGDHAVIEVVDGGQPTRGEFEIVVPVWAAQSSVYMLGGTFQGKVWAPFGQVKLSSNRDVGDRIEPTDVFGMYLFVNGWSLHEVLDLTDDGNAEDDPPAVSLQSWSN